MLPVSKSALLIGPVSKTNGATAEGYVDCKGFKFASIVLAGSASNTASNNCSVLKVTEGDTTTASTAITALTGDGEGGFTIANASTVASVVAKFNIDLRGRKRYLRLTASPTTTQILSATCELHKAEIAPDSAEEAGADNLVEA